MMKPQVFSSRTGMRRSLTVCSFLTLTAAAMGCGVQEHGPSKAGSSSGGDTGSPATGGSTATGSGGQVAGASGGSGGTTAGSGGSNGSGGGVARGSGGTSSGTGGRASTGSGGASTSSGGSNAATGGSSGGTASGGASGITINIAGTAVPKEKAIAILHLGHSNMLGHGVKPTDLTGFFYDTQAQLWVYRGSNNFVLAKEPTAPSVSTDKGAGPGMAILKTMAAAAPADYHFISIGRGEGSSTSVDWLKASNFLYPTVMTRALELKGKVTFGAIFIMQGITERHLPSADQPGFPQRIVQIVADLRADLGEPNIPVLFCDYEMGATGQLAPTRSVGTAAIPMIRSLPGMIANLELVPTDGLGMQDDHHFDLSGQKVWSERGVKIMMDKGWFRWSK